MEPPNAQSPAPRSAQLLTAGLALSVTLLRLWPLPLHPRWLVGHPEGEAPNHFRMFWRAGVGEGVWENLPTGRSLPLMDPINLPAWWLGALGGPALAYDAVLVFNLLLAFAGAYFLARALGAGVDGARLAGVAAVSAPALAGAVSFGITEALPVGWLALHLALVWGARARGGAWRWALAGLCLAAFALSGWYNALFGLVVEACVVLPLLARRGLRGPVLAQGLLALLLVIPFFWDFWQARGLWEGRWAMPEALPDGAARAWRHTPYWGTDLLNLVLPAREAVPVSKGVYAGLVTLALALRARARSVGIAVAVLWVLALGHWLRVGGWDSGLALPARGLTVAIPPLVGLSHWYRAAIPASVLLAALAGVGADRGRARSWLVLVLLDHLLLSQVELPLRMIDPTPPAAYAALTGAGGVVQLPFDNPAEFAPNRQRIYDLWQPLHGHPMAENYEGPDALLRLSPLVARWDALSAGRAAVALPDAARPGALRQLRTWEIGFVVLHRDRAADPEAAAAALRADLGEPIRAEGGVEVFALPR